MQAELRTYFPPGFSRTIYGEITSLRLILTQQFTFDDVWSQFLGINSQAQYNSQAHSPDATHVERSGWSKHPLNPPLITPFPSFDPLP